MVVVGGGKGGGGQKEGECKVNGFTAAVIIRLDGNGVVGAGGTLGCSDTSLPPHRFINVSVSNLKEASLRDEMLSVSYC